MVNSTKGIVVIFAKELHKQRTKRLTTLTGIQSKLRTPGATIDQGPPAEIRTQSGRAVKQPKYLKDNEL